MRVSVSCLLVPLILSVIGVKPGHADEFKPIEKEAAFRAKVVEKRLVYERGGTVVFLRDGTFAGDFAGSPVTGEWRWDDDNARVCHQLSIGEKKYDRDCRVPEVDRRKIRFVQEDGHSFGIARIH